MRGGSVKEKVNKGSAWLAQALAIAAGAAVLGTFIGQWTAAAFRVLPNELKVMALVGMVLWAVYDWIQDGVPNKQALYIGIAVPSLAAGLDGKLAANVLSGSKRLLDYIDGAVSPWVGTGSAIGLAGVLAVAAFVIARRTVQGR